MTVRETTHQHIFTVLKLLIILPTLHLYMQIEMSDTTIDSSNCPSCELCGSDSWLPQSSPHHQYTDAQTFFLFMCAVLMIFSVTAMSIIIFIEYVALLYRK
jgi:hypothetical protein